MRRPLKPRSRLAAAAAVALVAGLGSVIGAQSAVAADGPPPRRTGITIEDLRWVCASEDGEMFTSDMCILPSGEVIFCNSDGRACVILRQAPNTPKPSRKVGNITAPTATAAAR